MRLDKSQKDLLAEKIMDSANYALAGLVFGQLFTDEIQPLLVILGVLLYLWFMSASLWLKREVKQK